MTNATRATGIAIATAAALLFSTLPASAVGAEDAKVQCMGVNSCKGQSACKTANSSCKGQNSCKGHGFLELTQKDCDAAQENMKKETQ